MVVVYIGGSGDSLVFPPINELSFIPELSFIQVSKTCRCSGILSSAAAWFRENLDLYLPQFYPPCAQLEPPLPPQHGHNRVDLSNPSCFSSPVLEGAVTPHSPACSSPTFPKQNLLRLNLTAQSHQYQAFPSHLISPSPSSCFVYPINSNHPLFPQHTRTQPHLQHLRQQKPPQNIQGTPSEDLHVWGNPRDWRFFFSLEQT